VCVVTRGNRMPKGLENIPVNKLIVETSKPLGEARRRAIAQVETPFFAFIDDDMEISPSWYKVVKAFMLPDVGCVLGGVKDVGLGIFDRVATAPTRYREFKFDERIFTNNILIRTDVVRDWVPSPNRQICYEDLDIGNHVMRRGYKVIGIPTDTLHLKTWREIARNAMWGGSEWVRATNPSLKRHIWQYIRLFAAPFYGIVTRGLLHSIFIAYRNFFFILGMVAVEAQKMRRLFTGRR